LAINKKEEDSIQYISIKKKVQGLMAKITDHFQIFTIQINNGINKAKKGLTFFFLLTKFIFVFRIFKININVPSEWFQNQEILGNTFM